ncbi:MAG: hypothetical protein R3304_08590 [Longimicrobiales bacterium]|nr:hypothetical protein [Longimicrobiales bacterium]
MSNEQEGVPRESPFRAGAKEIVVIALGILLAFAVDASWASFRERAETRATLGSVRAELEHNIVALQELEAAHLAVAEAGRQILQLTGPDAEVEDDEALIRLITSFWVPVRSSFSRGALQAMLASGRLSNVQSLELREGLASWPDELDASDRADAEVAESWTSRGSIRLHVFVPEVNLSGRYADWESPSRFEADYVGLLRDLQFESLVAQRMALSAVGARRAARLRQAGERILSLPGW